MELYLPLRFKVFSCNLSLVFFFFLWVYTMSTHVYANPSQWGIGLRLGYVWDIAYATRPRGFFFDAFQLLCNPSGPMRPAYTNLPTQIPAHAYSP